jgi:hypothetical protein
LYGGGAGAKGHCGASAAKTDLTRNLQLQQLNVDEELSEDGG